MCERKSAPFTPGKLHKKIVHSGTELLVSRSQTGYARLLNCNGSESDQFSDLKTDSGTVLNLMFWAQTCFGTYVRICIRLCSYLSQLCKGILNHLCHASELYHM